MTDSLANQGRGRRGVVRVAALGTLAVGAAAVATYVALGGLGSTAGAAALASEPGPSPVALEITLAASGLSPRALAAADQAGAVTGVGAYPFVIITTLEPSRSLASRDGRALAEALRAQGAWLVVDPGLAGLCVTPT